MSKIHVYIKEYSDTLWTDISDRVVNVGFKLRRGFSSLGATPNLNKLDITYRASDLAVAAVFHTTAKQIRIVRDGSPVWEGYTEGNASVTSTPSSSLAWVKMSAYPYIHALEKITSTSEEVLYNVYMSQPQQTASSLLHLLWNKAVALCESPFKEALQSLYTINFPAIAVQRSIVVLPEGTNYLNTFLEILKQYCYVMTFDGFVIDFVQPYADDYRTLTTVPYTSVQSAPAIKTAPYRVETQPVVTLTRIITKNDCQLFSLAEEGENAGQELYIGASYPEEGDYEEISYSNDSIESDTCKLIYARTPDMTYVARYSDNSADAPLRIDRSELGGTSGKIKLTNSSTVLSVFLNQLWIKAEMAYFEDTSVKVTTAQVSKGDKEAETTTWLSDEENARLYCLALISQQKADTASLTFSSGKLEGIEPNSLIKVGNISAVYIVKQIEEDMMSGEKTYTCAVFKLTQSTKEVYSKSGAVKNRGTKGDTYQFVIDSTAGTFFRETSDVTILICRIYKNGSEDDKVGAYKYAWTRSLRDGTTDSSYTPEQPTTERLTALGINLDSFKAIIVRSANVDELNTYSCVVEN